jgi:hypothetical protein
MTDQPIDIHFSKLEEWLTDRRAVLAKSHAKDFDTCLKAAPRLLQLVKYDIPALRKQLQKLTSQMDESSKAIGGADKNKQGWRRKRQALLESIGIVADSFEEGADAGEYSVLVIGELLDARIDAVAIEYCASVKEKLSKIFPAFGALYETHLASCMPRGPWVEQHFPWLQRLFDECSMLDVASDNKKSEEKIQNEQAADDAPIAIQWDDEDLVEVPAGAAAVEPACGSGEGSLLPPAPGATGTGPTVLLTRPDHRSAVTEELHAAIVFVRERVLDLAGTKSADAVAFAPRESAVLEGLEKVQQALSLPLHVDLLRMRSSFRNKERFLQNFENLQRGLSVVAQRTLEHEARLASTSEEAAKCNAELSAVLSEARKLQQQTETALNKIFAPRPVSIVGEINKILQ